MGLEEERIGFLQKWREALDGMEEERFTTCMNQMRFLLSTLPQDNLLRRELETEYKIRRYNAEQYQRRLAEVQQKSRKLSQKMQVTDWSASAEWSFWYEVYDLFTNKFRDGGLLHTRI